MRLIAESGSTKTDWALIKGTKVIFQTNTIGFNPLFIKPEQMIQELEQSELKQFKNSVKDIHFYGAGCSSFDRNKNISSGLSLFFTEAAVSVDSDLKAACRGLFGNKTGITVILGTGSNAAVYDGVNILKSPPSLGYILGDEGSGNHLGRLLIKDYLENKMPASLRKIFDLTYNLNRDIILQKIYKENSPNRF